MKDGDFMILFEKNLNLLGLVFYYLILSGEKIYIPYDLRCGRRGGFREIQLQAKKAVR